MQRGGEAIRHCWLLASKSVMEAKILTGKGIIIPLHTKICFRAEEKFGNVVKFRFFLKLA